MTKTLSLKGIAVTAGVAAIALGFVLSMQTVYAASSLFGDAEIVAGGNPGSALQIRSDATPGFGGANFDDANGTLFSTLSSLMSDYNVTDDSCGGGSPRFQIHVDENNNDVDEAGDGNIFVYFGPAGSFTGCTPNTWLSTGELIGNGDVGRWDASQITGGTYGTYAQALVVAGSMKIWDISLLDDSSWSAAATGGDGEQTTLIDNVVINSATYDFTPAPVTVTIEKYIDDVHATAGNANSAAFPMSATWAADNISAGSGSYDLDADGFNGNPTPYQAITSEMTSGADYSTYEVTGGSVVGATCADGKPFALVGYTTGDTLAEAAAAAPSATVPAFTDLTENKVVIVWNTACVPPVPTATVTMCKTDDANAPLSGWTLTLKGDSVQDLVVPTNTSAGINSSSLVNGMSYIATAVGTWANQGGANPVDAEYSTTDGWATHMDGYTGYQTDLLELQINSAFDPASAWGVYNSAHTYAQSFLGSGAPANFRIFDGTGTTQNEAWFGDNSGTLAVNISEGYAGITGNNGCVTFTDVPYDTYAAGEVMQDGWSNVSGLGSVVVDSPTESFTIINNDDTLPPPPPPSVANACETSGVAPAGYILQNGTAGHDTVTLTPNTMFVGLGGNDKVTGGNGNFIICLGSGNDKVNLGNGDVVVDAGAGNNKVTTGNGTGTILTENGNDTIVTGDGDHTINVDVGNDKVTTGGGEDTIDAGSGNNTVMAGDGDDSITALAGNDKIDGEGGTDTCAAGAGFNVLTSCEL